MGLEELKINSPGPPFGAAFVFARKAGSSTCLAGNPFIGLSFPPSLAMIVRNS
jgi:hypothetical protein